MACDRFIYWRNGVPPSRDHVQLVLEDYVRDLATEVKWDGDRFFVLLPGMGSHPATRLPAPPEYAAIYRSDRENERWFEVYLGTDNIDVITRRSDRITSAIATEFARICAQFWQGELEMG